MPFVQWAQAHNVDPNAVEGKEDLQSARFFPVLEDITNIGKVLSWMLGNAADDCALEIWKAAEKYSADEISAYANLQRLTRQRDAMRADNMTELAENYRHSVFFQIDLDDAARCLADNDLAIPAQIDSECSLMQKIHDNMFRSEVKRLKGIGGEEESAEDRKSVV